MTVLPEGHGQLLPRSRTPLTSQTLGAESTSAHVKSKSASRSDTKPQAVGARQDTAPSEAITRASTLSLIRRTLAPDAPISPNSHPSTLPVGDILPPLTSSNEADTQLYAIISIIVRDFVTSWYSQITPDQNFRDEIITSVAHISRAIEERLRRFDVTQCLLHELPVLLEEHVMAYRTARMYSQQYHDDENIRRIYHTLNPHPALESPNNSAVSMLEEENEVVYRQLLVQGVLAALLPGEDLQNAPLRLLLSDILADLIIGQTLANKMCEGWFWQDIIVKSIAVSGTRVTSQTSLLTPHNVSGTRLEKYGLTSSSAREKVPPVFDKQPSRLSSLLWRTLQVVYLSYLALAFVIRGLMYAPHRPRRKYGLHKVGTPSTPQEGGNSRFAYENSRPIMAYGIFGFIASLVRLDARMPWLKSVFEFVQHVLVNGRLQLAAADSILDRYFIWRSRMRWSEAIFNLQSSELHTNLTKFDLIGDSLSSSPQGERVFMTTNHKMALKIRLVSEIFLYNTVTAAVLPPSVIEDLLLTVRTNVFPNNNLGPPAPPPPGESDLLQIRRDAAASLLSLVPSTIARGYFNTDDEQEILEIIEYDILDVFGDVYMNKHLVYRLLECVLVRLVPELAKQSVSELLAERGVDLEASINTAKEASETSIPDEE